MPKSPTSARSPSVMKIFAGLMSRWTMPTSCAASRPRETSAASRKPSVSENGPADARRSPIVPPGTNLEQKVKRAIVVLEQVVDGDEVGMVADARARLGLTNEAVLELAEVGGIPVGERSLEGLDGDGALQALVERPHNTAKCPLTDHMLDAISVQEQFR